jgi:hypothetical protein
MVSDADSVKTVTSDETIGSIGKGKQKKRPYRRRQCVAHKRSLNKKMVQTSLEEDTISLVKGDDEQSRREYNRIQAKKCRIRKQSLTCNLGETLEKLKHENMLLKDFICKKLGYKQTSDEILHGREKRISTVRNL